MNFWQVAAGKGARDYSSVFLQFGVMLIGRGAPGSYLEHPEHYKGHNGWRTQVVRFAEQAQCGDIVILKRPYHKEWRIVAAGHITGEYEWREQFEDVEGWDIQHCRKIDWVCPPPSRESGVVKGLAMGTFKQVHQKEPRDKALQLLDEGEKQESKEIPPPANRISDEDLVESLIGNGLRPADAETVIQTIWRVRRLARWYERYGRDLSEHEIRTFLIVPVLLALGWSEQRIKIEWKQTDVSLFHEVFKRGIQPEVILESKRIGEGLRYAERQAERYARHFPRCRQLVASNGALYQLYTKQDHTDTDRIEWNMNAYLNLLNLKDRHPYLAGVSGAPVLFTSLMPR